jgi:hypothetical protein
MLLWAASMMTIVLAAVGTRVAFALPLDLRANWVFRITEVPGGLESLAASRRALLLVAAAPVWLATAVVCITLWPSRQNAAHLVALGFLGMIVADICLFRFRKIPFTCSWLPGKSHFHMAFLGAFGLFLVGSQAATWERQALLKTDSMVTMLVLLAIAWICIRWTIKALTKGQEHELRFEEEAPPEVQGLGLYRDGALSITHPQPTRTR